MRRDRRWMRRGGLGALLGLALAASPAHAALNGPSTPPPKGCAPVAAGHVAPGDAQVCVHRVLVTQTTASQEQNHTDFTVTDHVATLAARVPNWWPSGGPVAGMVITMWGHETAGLFAVDRWVDLTHGTGPSPAGPYAETRLLDAAAGRLPEHRMTWVRATPFLLDPQDQGDGDIHVQTFSPCPAAGLTTETTPPMRGYVDHPGALPSSTDTTDPPHNHLDDAPPPGVPVMILGAMRYDYGFGWWELHPIRAWRFLTAAESAQQAADCAADPAPHLDPSAPVPVPFGTPPCTDGSEFGNAPGFMPCGPRCYVARTVVDQPEQLAGPCGGIAPIVTRSLESAAESTPGSTGLSATSPPPGTPATRRPAGHVGRGSLYASLDRVYGKVCRQLRRLHGHRSRAYRLCLNAMARLAGGETRSSARACRQESRRTTRRRRVSDFSLCVRAGRRLLASRVRED